jgi:collagen type I/II/III/V/XI/XXIV/XXVII alpha
VVDATQAVSFIGGPGTLTIGTNGAVAAIAGFHAQINSFNSNDTIVVDTPAAATFALNGSVVTVSTGGTLAFTGTAAAQTAFNTAGALVDQVVVPCFAAGTRIETVAGPVAVERLRVGDEVRTLLGGPGRIVWVGSRTVDCGRHPRPERVWPVRIARNAFGPGLPGRALFVSPDHALYLDGVLIPAKLLVNGTTVRQVARRHVVYYHIELERHDVVLAEGLPAETYLDTGDRVDFAGETTVRLFPDFAARLAPDVARVWETKGAAPLVMAGEELAAARAGVAAHATGWNFRPVRGVSTARWRSVSV